MNAPLPTAEPLTPAAVIERWINTPKRTRYATRIAPLDQLCNGGLTAPRRVFVVGHPGANKTGIAVCIANALEDEGCSVGFLAVDEEPEAITMRLSQLAGFDRSKLEDYEAAECTAARDDIAAAHFRFYEFETTIEAAAEDVAKWARKEGRPGVLVIDSIQTVTCRKIEAFKSAREAVEANVRALKVASDKYGLIVIATSEANRASYRDQAAPTNALAAGAESRAIEYAAQLQLVMSADAEDQTVFRVNVAKNRGYQKGEFAVRMNAAHHTLTPIGQSQLRAEQRERSANEREERERARAGTDADLAAREIAASPGITRNALLSALKERHGGFDERRLVPALEALGDRLSIEDGPNRSKRHYIDREVGE